MITYDPLWETMKSKGVSTYRLVTYFNFSRGTLDKLKHNRNVTTETIGRLCTILDCSVPEVMQYLPDTTE
ncbi:MAG: helix-turn-helix transcriptional regulator [Lachnospiraceae bacterium]